MAITIILCETESKLKQTGLVYIHFGLIYGILLRQTNLIPSNKKLNGQEVRLFLNIILIIIHNRIHGWYVFSNLDP